MDNPNKPVAKAAWFRAEVVEELFGTERDYFFDLRTIIEVSHKSRGKHRKKKNKNGGQVRM